MEIYTEIWIPPKEREPSVQRTNLLGNNNLSPVFDKDAVLGTE